MITTNITTLDPEKLPDQFKEWEQWTLSEDKKPVNDRRKGIDFTDKKNLGSFKKIYREYLTYSLPEIGFSFFSDDPFLAIDLDDCRDRKTGDIKPWAKEWVNYFETYTEISMSSTGLHLFLDCPNVELSRNKINRPTGDGRSEVYNENHFFVLTGNVLPGYDKIKSITASSLKNSPLAEHINRNGYEPELAVSKPISNISTGSSPKRKPRLPKRIRNIFNSRTDLAERYYRPENCGYNTRSEALSDLLRQLNRDLQIPMEELCKVDRSWRAKHHNDFGRNDDQIRNEVNRVLNFKKPSDNPLSDTEQAVKHFRTHKRKPDEKYDPKKHLKDEHLNVFIEVNKVIMANGGNPTKIWLERLAENLGGVTNQQYQIRLNQIAEVGCYYKAEKRSPNNSTTWGKDYSHFN